MSKEKINPKLSQAEGTVKKTVAFSGIFLYTQKPHNFLAGFSPLQKL